MRKILLLCILFFHSLNPFAQTGGNEDTILIQKIPIDSTWNHSMDEADLILKVDIKKKYFMTFYGHYFFDVLEVMKGEFEQKSGHFELGLVDFSRDAYEKKYRALDSNIVYVGFKKITEENPSGYFMTDTITGIKWGFWMSEIVDRRQRKGAEFDFCHRILLHLCCGISSKDNYEAKMVELRKKWAVEDSLFDIAETKRCAAAKDSLHLIHDFKPDSTLKGDLLFISGGPTEDLLPEMDPKTQQKLDSLVNGIGNIDTSLDIDIIAHSDISKLLPLPRKEVPESLLSYIEVESEPKAAYILPPLVCHSPISFLNDFWVLEYSPDDLSRKFEKDSITSSTESSFLFYPNPASDFISIYFEEKNHPVQFSIVDMCGRKFYDEKIMGPIHKVDVSDFSSGTYFLILNFGDGQVKKLVVE